MSVLVVQQETTKFQYTTRRVADVSRIDPDDWEQVQPLLNHPGNKDVQLDLFLDYGGQRASLSQNSGTSFHESADRRR